MQVYWQIYSTLYLGAQDALVAFYPSIPDLSDDRNYYEGRQDVLTMWI